LAGLRVLDLSRVLAAPWATQILGDLGAEVLKVERPGKGDDTRGWGPPFLQDGSARPDAAYYLCANRNKRSVAIDFARPEGAALVRRLASDADVLVENFRTGGLAKYGLDAPALLAANPRLIYCSVTGFGHTGPYAARGGYDFLIQGMSGLMSVTGRPEGEPGAGPLKVGVPVSDLFTGLYATVAILAALNHRDRSGEGQHIDCALLDSQVALLVNQAMNYLVGGEVPRRLGNAHPNVVPYRDFAASDDYVLVACGNDGQFRALCALLGRDDLAADPRFATNPLRVQNRAALVPPLEELLRTRTTAAWQELLEAAEVPHAPVWDYARLFSHPQALARGLRVEVRDPAGRPLDLLGPPFHIRGATPPDPLAPPALGQHTEEVLARWLGLDSARVDELRRRGVV
jgi:crotonobetainyl-CoA:carnitine CoA-transferase CaiB-like acyl-CoA transferase